MILNIKYLRPATTNMKRAAQVLCTVVAANKAAERNRRDCEPVCLLQHYLSSCYHSGCICVTVLYLHLGLWHCEPFSIHQVKKATFLTNINPLKTNVKHTRCHESKCVPLAHLVNFLLSQLFSTWPFWDCLWVLFTRSKRRKEAEADVETLGSGRRGWAWCEPAYNLECDLFGVNRTTTLATIYARTWPSRP